MIEICFVCTENTCRSVMAERIARKIAKKKGIKDIKFTSAGIREAKQNISQNAVFALKQLGYDSRNRKSVKLKKINPQTIYVAVTDAHKQFINAKKCLSFSDFGEEIEDPYGQSIDVYLKTAKLIEGNVGVLLDKIEKLRGAL